MLPHKSQISITLITLLSLILVACNPDDDASNPTQAPTQYLTEMLDPQGLGYSITYDGTKLVTLARSASDNSATLTAAYEYNDTLVTKISRTYADGTQYINIFKYDNLGTLKTCMNVSLVDSDTTAKTIETLTFDENRQIKSSHSIVLFSNPPVNQIQDTTITYYTWANGNIKQSDTYDVIGEKEYLQYSFFLTYDSMRNFSNQSLAMAYSVNPLIELGLSKNNCTSVVGNSGSGPINLGTLKYTYNENGYPITREQSGGKQFFFSASLKYK